MGRSKKGSAHTETYEQDPSAAKLPRLLGQLSACHFEANPASESGRSQKQARRKRDVLLGAAGSRRRTALASVQTASRNIKHAFGSAAHSVGEEVQHVSHGVSHAVQHVGHEIARAVRHRGSKQSHLMGIPRERMQTTSPCNNGWIAFLADCIVSICHPKVLCDPTDSILGRLVKSALASLDSEILGVKLSVGDVRMDALRGTVEILDLVVANPNGYYSEYLLRADRIFVDINTQILVESFGSIVDVEEVIIEGVDIIVEKKLQTSNLNDMLTKLSGSQTCGSGDDPHTSSSHSQVQVVWHKVMAKDVGAKLAWSVTHGHGIRVEVSDMSFEDFDKHKGSDRGCMTCALSARMLLRTLIKSIVATLLGKESTRHLVHGFHKLEAKLRKVPGTAACLPWKSSVRKSHVKDSRGRS
eukprot:TRINITY_DN102524_c0_g1_i1.p1 TRINITY_DN102524_c0_g1~~TRINITY_DN102524_c0_g1_i1.p1  ORF type:complete len:414 (-),score=58.64 TRINITY_DN102524_c0_g1_i1:487-1728(-)